nr:MULTISPECIES: hypothetical protein [Actinopolyspora]
MIVDEKHNAGGASVRDGVGECLIETRAGSGGAGQAVVEVDPLVGEAELGQPWRWAVRLVRRWSNGRSR